MKGSFTFLSLLCSFSAKGNSFLIQSKSFKMKYIYQYRGKKKRNEKGKWALLTCPCITMWVKLKTYIVSWKLICVKNRWQVLTVYSRAGLQSCVSFPSSWLLSTTEVRAEEQFHCKTKTAFMKVSHRIQRTVCKGESALESIYNTEWDRTRSLWFSLRDLLHNEGDANFETQRLKCSNHESADTFSSSPLNPLKF